KKIIHRGSLNKRIAECKESAIELRDRLRTWLDSDGFRAIDRRLREELNRDEIIRFLIRTEEKLLHKLPWQEWDFFERYPKAEVALSAVEFEKPRKSQTAILKESVRILAILGNSKGIDIEVDRRKLEALPGAEVEFLVEPERQQLNDRLWEQPWDILFFAGHSETKEETGHLYINQTDSLSLDELKYGLKQAIAQGLHLAICNSCDGLGLASALAQLHIPQMIVMREPVPDKVAQEFLNYFLNAFANGDSLYLAERQARERLQGLEHQFPCASWLPVICQNPVEIPPNWRSLQGQTEEQISRNLTASAMVTLEVTKNSPFPSSRTHSSSLLVGRYKIIRPLGSGGFSQTYLAEDLHRPGHPRCVVKQLKPQFSDSVRFQKAQQLFDREAEVLQQLGNHDQIPRLLAHFEEQQEFYLVEEWIEGHNLEEELQHPLPENQVISLLRDLLTILEFVHRKNVIHRDIKPANIIRRQQDRKLVLIDFGAVKQVGENAPNPDNLTVIGSAGYMPPEQRAGSPQFASDIYAVGMLGIRALTGRSLHSLPRNTNGELLWHNQVKVTRKLAQILDKMVSVDATQRYQTATEVLQSLSSSKPIYRPLFTSLPSLPRRGWYRVVLASFAATSLVMGMRSLRLLEFLELQAYDYLMWQRPPELIDERILVVEVTQEDIAEHQYP
ncbi:MAG TPA: protein kinase, partial [Coleofasciculaceae cyanobacterium]